MRKQGGKIGSLRQRYQTFSGFTVTELLIVISVIAILASIVIVAYPGYQQRARNAERKSDVAQVAAALSAYAIQNNSYVGSASGCGMSGNGNGFLAATSAQVGTYQNSILSCLQTAGVLDGGTFVDPSGCLANIGSCVTSPVRAYMKVSCTKGAVSVHYVLAYLESEPPKAAEVNGLCDAGTVAGFSAATQQWGTLYGMNYYVTAK